MKDVHVVGRNRGGAEDDDVGPGRHGMRPLDVQRDLDAGAVVVEVGVVAAVVGGRQRCTGMVDEGQAGRVGQAEGLVEDRQGAGAVVGCGGVDEGGVVALLEDADGLAGAVSLDAAEGDVVVIGSSGTEPVGGLDLLRDVAGGTGGLLGFWPNRSGRRPGDCRGSRRDRTGSAAATTDGCPEAGPNWQAPSVPTPPAPPARHYPR